MKDLRTALLLSNNNAVLKSFVSQHLHPRIEVPNFIVGFPTLLLLDSSACASAQRTVGCCFRQKASDCLAPFFVVEPS